MVRCVVFLFIERGDPKRREQGKKKNENISVPHSLGGWPKKDDQEGISTRPRDAMVPFAWKRWTKEDVGNWHEGKVSLVGESNASLGII